MNTWLIGKNEPKRTQFKANSNPISRPPRAIDNGCPVQEIDYEKFKERLCQERSAVIMLNLSQIKKVVCFERFLNKKYFVLTLVKRFWHRVMDRLQWSGQYQYNQAMWNLSK